MAEDEDWLLSDEDEHGPRMEQRDRLKIETQFHDVRWEQHGNIQMGYREGMEAGKLATLQAGFDQGYNESGVPLGRAFGMLHGEAETLYFFISRRDNLSDEQKKALEQLHILCQEVASSTLQDLSEPDWENLEHELVHHSQQDVAATLRQRREEWATRKNQLEDWRTLFNAIKPVLLP